MRKSVKKTSVFLISALVISMHSVAFPMTGIEIAFAAAGLGVAGAEAVRKCSSVLFPAMAGEAITERQTPLMAVAEMIKGNITAHTHMDAPALLDHWVFNIRPINESLTRANEKYGLYDAEKPKTEITYVQAGIILAHHLAIIKSAESIPDAKLRGGNLHITRRFFSHPLMNEAFMDFATSERIDLNDQFFKTAMTAYARFWGAAYLTSCRMKWYPIRPGLIDGPGCLKEIKILNATYAAIRNYILVTSEAAPGSPHSVHSVHSVHADPAAAVAAGSPHSVHSVHSVHADPAAAVAAGSPHSASSRRSRSVDFGSAASPHSAHADPDALAAAHEQVVRIEAAVSAVATSAATETMLRSGASHTALTGISQYRSHASTAAATAAVDAESNLNAVIAENRALRAALIRISGSPAAARVGRFLSRAADSPLAVFAHLGVPDVSHIAAVAVATSPTAVAIAVSPVAAGAATPRVFYSPLATPTGREIDLELIAREDCLLTLPHSAHSSDDRSVPTPMPEVLTAPPPI